MVKNPPPLQEMQVRSPAQEDPLEKGMATPSSILAWRIPWTEEPGRLQPMGHKASDVTEDAGVRRSSPADGLSAWACLRIPHSCFGSHTDSAIRPPGPRRLQGSFFTPETPVWLLGGSLRS